METQKEGLSLVNAADIFFLFFFKDWSRYLWFQWQHHRRTLQTVDASGSILPILQEPQLWRFRSKLCFLLKITLSYTTTCPLISLLIITLTEFENRTVLMKSERLGFIRVNWECTFLATVLWTLVVPTPKEHRDLCEPPGWLLGAPWHQPDCQDEMWNNPGAQGEMGRASSTEGQDIRSQHQKGEPRAELPHWTPASLNQLFTRLEQCFWKLGNSNSGYLFAVSRSSCVWSRLLAGEQLQALPEHSLHFAALPVHAALQSSHPGGHGREATATRVSLGVL